MSSEKETTIGYYFIVMASIIVVLAGIKNASEIIIPFLLSLFLAIILLPFYDYFNKKKFPNSISLTIVISIFILLIFFVAKLVGSSIQNFNANIELYSQQLSVYYYSLTTLLLKIGIEISVEDVSSVINSKNIMSFATKIMQSMGSMFTNGFVVLLTVVFMLLESKHFSSKIEYIGKNSDAVSHIHAITTQIKE